MTIEKFKKYDIPDGPGVYFFLGKNKKIIYIGKATSLKDRVRSYFSPDLFATRGGLLVRMLQGAVSLEWKETGSVLEALMLEADLIKKFKPECNTREKDDKSFLCIVITKEDFPQVLTIRKKDINFETMSLSSGQKIDTIYGPYTHGLQLREALKIVRKIFPYRDEKCKLDSKRPCFNYAIGLCPGTCIGALDKHCYAIRIRRIKLFLSGKIKNLVKDLERDMNSLAKKQEFEAAKILRDKIYAIEHIRDISLIKGDIPSSKEFEKFRIEAYDVAHLGGKDMVGVMVALSDGEPDKNSYRKFKIRSVSASNDPKALGEVLSRRLNHPEWPLPNLFAVDGNEVQKGVAERILLEKGISIPVVAVTKDKTHKASMLLGDEGIVSKHKKAIILANSEAHRFSITYHKKLRGKSFLR